MENTMEFIIVTGYSGAGKTIAMHALEDIGFYCLDNIPPKLIEPFYDLCLQSREHFKRVAVVTDIRGGSSFSLLKDTLDNLKENGRTFKILFLDADETVRLNRYKETRRRHPLIDEGVYSLEDAMDKEGELLKPLRQIADYVIDSTHSNPTQTRQKVINLFLNRTSDALQVSCMSFGFKNGVPAEADLVFDVRCLPNPFYVPELKNLTGLDAAVKDYVFKWPETEGLVERIISLIDYTVPLYVKEGKSQLVIAIGCTGGHHRSVAISQLIYEHLIDKNIKATINHRDIRR